MNFAPFAFQQQVSAAGGGYIPLPVTTGLVINTDANSTTSYPGTGTIWYDLQGNYNATLYNSPTFNSGTPSYFSFDGTNDYAYFGDSSAGSDSSSYTAGGWFNATTSGTDKVWLFRGEDGFGSGWSFGLYKNTSNVIFMSIVAGGSQINVSSSITLVSNTWYHVYGVFTSGSSIKIYVNGVLRGTTSTGQTTLRSSSRGWEIARANGAAVFQAGVGSCNIYNRALTDAEITSNFDAQKTLYGYSNVVTSNLSLWYDAGNTLSYPGSGTNWSNLQGTSLTSVLTNGPTYSTNNGGTIVFDGTNDYTTGPDNAILDFGTGDWTLEYWVRINANSSPNNDGLLSATIMNAINKSGTINGWAFNVRGDTTNTGQALIFERQINSVGTYPRYTLPAPGGVQTYLNKNQLYQLGMSHSVAGGTKFFINGVYYNADFNLTGNVNGTNALELGRLGITGYQLYLNGAIAIARIYNGKQLSAAELLQNYNADINRI